MARSSERLKSSVGVVFTTSTQANPKCKIKIFKNKTVDELLDCNFETPGIPLNANIKEVVIGDNLINMMKIKYKIKAD
jgi:hypothetical protein